MQTVLLCDDEPMNRKVASKILMKEGFHVIEATNGAMAIELLKKNRIELILMDLMMPIMDGYTATKIIKADKELCAIPLIITSALSDKNDIHKGLKLGANEYITKPFDILEFQLRVQNAVKLGTYHNMLIDNEKILKKEVAKQTQALRDALDEVKQNELHIISVLAKTAKYRDNETSAHTIRVGNMAALLAKKFDFSPEDVELMRLAAPMHDIGKIGIPDKILFKPEKLDTNEYEIMKEHTQIGASLLSQKDTPLLKLASTIANTHHEKYNGLGYPNGLKGNEIPISGAIVAVVDVFDALLSKRPYKLAYSLEETLKRIQSDSKEHFNPEVVSIFMENLDELLFIREQCQDV